MNFIRAHSMINRPLVCKVSSVTYSMQHPTRFLEVQESWRRKDGVSKRFQLIYKAPMERLLNYATAYLTFSSATVGGLGTYYAAFMYDKTELESPVIIGEDIVVANSAIEFFSYLGAFVAFHAAIKILLSKYVIRLYQDGDNYIAIFRGHMFNSIAKHEFKLSSVEKLQPSLVFAWSDARFSLGNKHSILLADYFKTPEYYNNLVYKRRTDTSDEE